MTLWSVEVSHLRMPDGPWCSWPSWAPDSPRAPGPVGAAGPAPGTGAGGRGRFEDVGTVGQCRHTAAFAIEPAGIGAGADDGVRWVSAGGVFWAPAPGLAPGLLLSVLPAFP